MIDKTAENDVLAAFVHHGTVATPFLHSLFAALAEDTQRASRGERRRLVEYTDTGGPYIQDNRCRVVRYLLQYTDYQWLWFLDNDMEFPRDSLYRLLQAAEEHDIKLLGAAYWNRYGKRAIYLSWLWAGEDGIKAVPTLPEGKDPMPVTALGMGCTLIHRSVLQDVVDWQRANAPGDPWDSFGADVLKYDDGTSERMGEDVTFCMRAARLGHQAFGLPTLTAEHFKAIFMPHGGVDASEDGENGVLGREIHLVPES